MSGSEAIKDKIITRKYLIFIFKRRCFMRFKRFLSIVVAVMLMIATYIATTVFVFNNPIIYAPFIKKANYMEEELKKTEVLNMDTEQTNMEEEKTEEVKQETEGIEVEETYYEICLHEAITFVTIKEATCSEEGKEVGICDECNETIEERVLNLLDCTYGKWVYTKYSTPVESGERYKKCSECGNTVSESYTMSMPGDDSIYIAGTDIKACYKISSFTQKAVDKYDIVYTEETSLGSNNPFILGHKYRTLGKLSQTKVGSYIYLSKNGEIETYKVIISEYGLQNDDETDIIGQTTGTSIWDTFDGKTLHIYSCYGKNDDGRWMVLATKI